MFLKQIDLDSDNFPTTEFYPFTLDSFLDFSPIVLDTPVTYFIGENGTGKSTLLEALAWRCGIHIWRDDDTKRVDDNPYEKKLYEYVRTEWYNGWVAGAYFSSDLFTDFNRNLELWAIDDPRMLDYYGGKSLISQSHGQSQMSYFKSRYQRKGLYLLDEPETALSPKSQIEFLELLMNATQDGNAQFIIVTHSPIILAYPGAAIHSFDHAPIRRLSYKETDYYTIYKDFMNNPESYIKYCSGG
ncbi:MAG: AAA family ATPase [Desulfobacteraceae bacterium]|nr:AAA family ATPase [Desulfobacteraceae bacterium]